jgi:hypothetical protein
MKYSLLERRRTHVSHVHGITSLHGKEQRGGDCEPNARCFCSVLSILTLLCTPYTYLAVPACNYCGPRGSVRHSRHPRGRTDTEPHSCCTWPLHSIGEQHERSHITGRAAIVFLISGPLKKPPRCTTSHSMSKCFCALCRAWCSSYSLREGCKMI